jgi:hypothetical protein
LKTTTAWAPAFRHSSIVDYYKMGNAIPGIRIDGMNVLPSAKA